MTEHPQAVLKQANRNLGSEEDIWKVAEWGTQIFSCRLSSFGQTPEMCYNPSQKVWEDCETYILFHFLTSAYKIQ